MLSTTIMSIYCSEEDVAGIAKRHGVPKKQVEKIKALSLSLTNKVGGGFRPDVPSRVLGCIRRDARFGWKVWKNAIMNNVSEDMVNLIVRIDDEETE